MLQKPWQRRPAAGAREARRNGTEVPHTKLGLRVSVADQGEVETGSDGNNCDDDSYDDDSYDDDNGGGDE